MEGMIAEDRQCQASKLRQTGVVWTPGHLSVLCDKHGAGAITAGEGGASGGILKSTSGLLVLSFNFATR